MKTRILGIIGSLNQNSLTRCGVRCVLENAQSLGAEIQWIDLLETPLPLFNPNHRESVEFSKAKELVIWANSFLLGSPDYHGSMSGGMKNFLDYFWKEFAGKLFGYLCASHEKGLTAMDQMRTSIRQCYGWSLPYGVSLTDGDFDVKTGKVMQPNVEKRLQVLACDLVHYTPLLWKQFEAEVQGTHSQVGFAGHYRPKKS